jgi:hypothetical protein
MKPLLGKSDAQVKCKSHWDFLCLFISSTILLRYSPVGVARSSQLRSLVLVQTPPPAELGSRLPGPLASRFSTRKRQHLGSMAPNSQEKHDAMRGAPVPSPQSGKRILVFFAINAPSGKADRETWSQIRSHVQRHLQNRRRGLAGLSTIKTTRPFVHLGRNQA